jgi:hypothetical protein
MNGLNRLRAIVDNPYDEPARRPLEHVKFIDMQPRLTGKPLIKGYLERQQISLIVGETGCGKTFFALDRDLHIAAGSSWFGCRVSQGPLVYVAAEAGRSIENRVVAWRHAHGLDDSDIPFAAITSPVDLCHADAGDVERLVEEIKRTGLVDEHAHGLGMLDVDTLNRAMAGGNENAPDDMGGYINSVDRLRDILHCHISSIHHFGKDIGRGSRGHNSLICAVDTETQVQNFVATITKQRDNVAGKTFPFKLEPIQLGLDEDGDPVTTCIVEQAGEHEKTPDKPRKVSPAQARALQMLDEAIATAGEVPPSNNHIPPNTRCVREDIWRGYCYSGGISDGSDDAKRIAFKRVGQILVGREVGKWDPWVWRTTKEGTP